VIHDYGDICQVVNEMAVKLDPKISAAEYQTFNKCLDLAMAEAITEYGRQRDLSLSDDESERLGYFAHEARNLLSNSMLAFQVLKTGTVGIESSTGALLGRNLRRLQGLIDNTLSEVRLKAGINNFEKASLAGFIEEIEVFATIEAKAKPVKLTIHTPPHDVWIEIDRQIVAAAIANLVQNAIKFTPAQGQITVRTSVESDHVLIDIEDECGGLTVENPEELFRVHEQRNEDKSGLGVGLGIARQGVMANGGKIRVRNLPGKREPGNCTGNNRLVSLCCKKNTPTGFGTQSRHPSTTCIPPPLTR